MLSMTSRKFKYKAGSVTSRRTMASASFSSGFSSNFRRQIPFATTDFCRPSEPYARRSCKAISACGSVRKVTPDVSSS